MWQCQIGWYKVAMTPERQEELRTELAKLRQKRDGLFADLDLYAQENNDLRENSAYINTERKIQFVDAQIYQILTEFEKWELAKRRAEYPEKLKKSPKLVKS